MNLDELLKSIRDEGKKESSLTVKPRSFESSDEKLVEEATETTFVVFCNMALPALLASAVSLLCSRPSRYFSAASKT